MINLIAYNQRSLRSILHAGRKHASAISLAMAVCKASAMPLMLLHVIVHVHGPGSRTRNVGAWSCRWSGVAVAVAPIEVKPVCGKENHFTQSQSQSLCPRLVQTNRQRDINTPMCIRVSEYLSI